MESVFLSFWLKGWMVLPFVEMEQKCGECGESLTEKIKNFL